MMHEEKKITKIIEELTMYFFDIGANHIKTEIKKEEDNVTILFESDYLPEDREKLHRLKEYLNEPRNEGMEDIYWELVGSGEPGDSSQWLLLGAMLDRADVIITDDHVKLILYKELMDD